MALNIWFIWWKTEHKPQKYLQYREKGRGWLVLNLLRKLLHLQNFLVVRLTSVLNQLMCKVSTSSWNLEGKRWKAWLMPLTKKLQLPLSFLIEYTWYGCWDIYSKPPKAMLNTSCSTSSYSCIIKMAMFSDYFLQIWYVMFGTSEFL